MHPNQTALHQLCTITRSLARLGVRHQILRLRDELLRALERGVDLQDRGRALELELAETKARAEHESRMLRSRSAFQAERFLVTLHELAETRAAARAERRRLHLEIVLLEMRGQALEAMCRALSLTIKRARGSQPGAPPPPHLPPYAQGSA
jgi:hypothetical protein